MSSREQVLTKIRAAVGAVRVEPADRTKEVPRGYRSTVPEADLVELFVERVEDYRAVVTRCAPDDLAQAVQALGLGGLRQLVQVVVQFMNKAGKVSFHPRLGPAHVGNHALAALHVGQLDFRARQHRVQISKGFHAGELFFSSGEFLCDRIANGGNLNV